MNSDILLVYNRLGLNWASCLLAFLTIGYASVSVTRPFTHVPNLILMLL
jgi:hypothetical protein